MNSNVLPFPARPNAGGPAAPVKPDGRIILLDDYRSRARRLRTANGVYFVSRVLASPEDCTAA